MEKSDHLEAFMIVYIISGKSPQYSVNLKDPLRIGWPDLAGQLLYRDLQSELSKRLELKAIRRINVVKVRGEVKFSDDLRTLAYYSYVGVNPSCSSPNFSLTMTDPMKEDGQILLTENNPKIQGKLLYPMWMDGVGGSEYTSASPVLLSKL
jgi:hypothetical protein